MTTMTCDELQQQFDDRLDERLSTAECAAFDAHVAACPTCQAEWQAYAAAWATVARHVAPEPSFGFAERTLRRLAEEPAPRLARWWTPSVRWAVLGVSAFALAVALGVYQHQTKVDERVTLYSAVSTVEPVDDLDVIVYLHELGGTDHL